LHIFNIPFSLHLSMIFFFLTSSPMFLATGGGGI
jgi:hypothetical protein